MTSDHGDYLGDHWLGEKELFHEESVHIPLIVYDPDAAADGSRGSVSGDLVEAIDLVPTFVEAVGGTVPGHMLEGRSIAHDSWRRRGCGRAKREAVFSECDYAYRTARVELAVPPAEARAYMVRTERWKYLFYEGFRPHQDQPALVELCRAARVHGDGCETRPVPGSLSPMAGQRQAEYFVL